MQRHIPASAAVPASRVPSRTGGNGDTHGALTADSGIRIADLTNLPPTVDIETAARILGCGRTLAYELVKRNEFPCRVLRVGKRYLIPTAALLEALGLNAAGTLQTHGEANRAAV